MSFEDIVKKINDYHGSLATDPGLEEPFSLGKMSLEDFLLFLEYTPKRRYRLWYRNGEVLVFGLPKRAHETPGGYICDRLAVYMAAKGIPEHLYGTMASPTCIIGQSVKEPDAAFCGSYTHGKVADPDGNVYPSLIVETSLFNESLIELEEELNLWLSDESSTTVAVGIKIFQRKKNGTRRILFILGVRDKPLECIEFGTDIESPQLFVEIPGRLICPFIVDESSVSFDLHVLRDKIIRALPIE